MKRKKLVCKSIALGLAVATAATTMSVPGGVLNPTAVYAEEAVKEVTPTADNFHMSTSMYLEGRPCEPYVQPDYQDFKNIKKYYKMKDSEEDYTLEEPSAAGTYEVYIDAPEVVKDGIKYNAVEKLCVGEFNIYKELPEDVKLTYNGSENQEEHYYNDVKVSVTGGYKIKEYNSSDEYSDSITIKAPERNGSQTQGVEVLVEKDGVIYGASELIEFDMEKVPVIVTTNQLYEPYNDRGNIEIKIDRDADVNKVYYLTSESELDGISSQDIADNEKKQETQETYLDLQLKDETKYYMYIVGVKEDGTLTDVVTTEFTTSKFNDITNKKKLTMEVLQDEFNSEQQYVGCVYTKEQIDQGIPAIFEAKDGSCSSTNGFRIQYEKDMGEGNYKKLDGCPKQTGEYLAVITATTENPKYYSTPENLRIYNFFIYQKVDENEIDIEYFDSEGNKTTKLAKDGYMTLKTKDGYQFYERYSENKFLGTELKCTYDDFLHYMVKSNKDDPWLAAFELCKQNDDTWYKAVVGVNYEYKKRDPQLKGSVVLYNGNNFVVKDTKLKVGDKLTVKPLGDYVDYVTDEAQYTWYRDQYEISGAKSPSYVLTKEDVGHTIKAKISNLEKNVDDIWAIETDGTAKIVGENGTIVADPSFEAYDEKNHTLELKGDAEQTYEYSVDSGATWKEVTLDGTVTVCKIQLENKAYKNGTIQARVKGTTGNPIIYDKDIVVPLAGNVTLTGTEKYGQTITAKVTGTQEGAALKYTFIRVKDGTETVAQETSDKEDYTIGKEDIGCTLKVKVTADGYDEGKPLESTETQIVKKADGRKVASVAGYMQQEGESYTYTVTPVPDAVYRMNDGKWQESNVFTGIKPGTQNVTFSAQIPEDDCYEAGEVKTSDPVSFAKLNREMPKLSYTVKDGENGSKIVTIDPVKGAVYYNNDGQTDSNEFTVPADKLEKVTIGIWLPETDIYLASKENKQTVNLSLETQTAPEAAVLTAKVNTAGTGYDIIVTEPKAEEGVTYEYSNTPWDNFGTLDQLTGLTNVAPGKEVVIYVRKAAVEGKKNASPVTACSIKTDLIKAEAPVITGPAAFNGTATVTMTAAGKIYYTTDGSTPTVNSNLYTDAITIDKTTTIKAIAVENGKPVSDVASLTLTKISSGSGSGSSGSGSSGSGATTGTTTPAVKPDSKPETTTETKPDGTVVTTTTTTAEDGTKNVVVELKNEGKSSIATVTISKDATGKTVKAEAVVTQIANKKVMSVSGALVAQITEAAGTKNVNVVTSVKDGKGAEIGTVTVNAEKLVAGKKLAIVKVNAKTGEKILVNAKNYKVAKDGSISVSGLKNGKYELVTTTEKTALSKKILKTVTAKNAKKTVKDGAKTTFAFGKDLNKENVKSVKYVSSKKSVAAIDKNGKIKAKKAGQTVVKAVVTLKDGTKKL